MYSVAFKTLDSISLRLKKRLMVTCLRIQKSNFVRCQMPSEKKKAFERQFAVRKSLCSAGNEEIPIFCLENITLCRRIHIFSERTGVCK